MLGVFSEGKKQPKPYLFAFPDTAWFLPDAPTNDLQTADDNWALDDFPETLSGFRTWWNRLQKVHNIDMPVTLFPEGRICQPHTKDDYVLLIDSEPPPASSTIFKVDLYLESVGGKNGGSEIGYSGWKFFFPITECNRVALDQSRLGSYFKNWNPGSFDTSFSDLAHAAQGMESLRFDDIRQMLAEEATKGPEIFEVFGMKLPAGQITLWGIIVLLCVQLYLLTYLRLLAGRLRPTDDGWDVPWIGMDSSRLARCILFVTLVLLPLIAVMLLAERAVSQGAHRRLLLEVLMLIGAQALACVLAVLSWRFRPRIVPETAEFRSSQLFE